MKQNWNYQRKLKAMRIKTPINGQAIYLRKIRQAIIKRKISALQKAKNDYKTLFRYEHLKMERSSLK